MASLWLVLREDYEERGEWLLAKWGKCIRKWGLSSLKLKWPDRLKLMSIDMQNVVATPGKRHLTVVHAEKPALVVETNGLNSNDINDKICDLYCFLRSLLSAISFDSH